MQGTSPAAVRRSKTTQSQKNQRDRQVAFCICRHTAHILFKLLLTIMESFIEIWNCIRWLCIQVKFCYWFLLNAQLAVSRMLYLWGGWLPLDMSFWSVLQDIFISLFSGKQNYWWNCRKAIMLNIGTPWACENWAFSHSKSPYFIKNHLGLYNLSWLSCNSIWLS